MKISREQLDDMMDLMYDIIFAPQAGDTTEYISMGKEAEQQALLTLKAKYGIEVY